MAYIVKVEDAKFSVVEGVKKACRESYDDIDKYVDIVIDIMSGIYADQYEESKPKIGWWTENKACSECGYQPWYNVSIEKEYRFCPNCGAKMGPKPLTTGTSIYMGGPWSIKAEDIT